MNKQHLSEINLGSNERGDIYEWRKVQIFPGTKAPSRYLAPSSMLKKTRQWRN